MNVKELFNVINEIAPKSLSDEYCEKYSAYDNSGVLIDTGAEVVGVCFSLDFSFDAIDCAVKNGANVLVTHHPAIYGKIGDIAVSETNPLKEKLIACIQKGISVISMHLNLDCAKDGIDEMLAQAIMRATGETDDTRICAEIEKATVMHPLCVGGYGRVYPVKESTLNGLVAGLKKELNAERVTVYGEEEKKIARVASFCGGGADEQAVAFAIQTGADAVISSDFKHHIITTLTERGVAVIALTHYATETYGFEKFYQKISRKIALSCYYCKEEKYL